MKGSGTLQDDNSSMSPGPIALFGSGEYLESMALIEASLLDGRKPNFIQIPTAASAEGPERLAYWIELGRAQARRLGVQDVAVPIGNRTQADNGEFDGVLAEAGLIYFSGGNPSLLVETLSGTRFLRLAIESWLGGSALAGCSAGAMALAGWIPKLRPTHKERHGFGVIPDLAVIPHFDRFVGRLPQGLVNFGLETSNGIDIVGVDEETALIWEDGSWRVEGVRSAWLIRDGERYRLGRGQDLATWKLPMPRLTLNP